MPTEPNQLMLNDETIPTIELIGKKWPIPLLAVRQLRLAIPALIRLAPLNKPEAFLTMADSQINDMFNVIWVALTRAHPTLTKEEFENWHLDLKDCFQALVIIMQQTAMMKPVTGNSLMGEVKGNQ